jgi:uncharacterized protein (DUF983 family)
MNDSSECPKCGKKTLVKRHEDLYQCLSCDFKKDFSTPEPDDGGLLGAIALIALLLAALMHQQSVSSFCSQPGSGCLPQSVVPSQGLLSAETLP